MKVNRRRGKVLEDEILNNTWELLKKVGYENLTMDNIAENAETTKTVLYRRWSGKPEIIIAAAKKHLPEFKLAAPNTGNLKEDLVEVFVPLISMIELLEINTVQGILRDQLSKISIIDILGMVSTENAFTKILEEIFSSAEERKEIDKSKLTSTTKLLPVYLILDTLLAGDLNRTIILHMIDDILLPTYKHTLKIAE